MSVCPPRNWRLWAVWREAEGCVVRHGYLVYSWGDTARSSDVASAVKPLISHLLLTAVQEGRIGSVDDPVSHFEPGLAEPQAEAAGAPVTWRHLASQSSGYGLVESAGFSNVLLEIANEHDHRGFDHAIIGEAAGQVELIELARKTHSTAAGLDQRSRPR